jgi:cyclopropane-fatty-acyl-phospholipid synthase
MDFRYLNAIVFQLQMAKRVDAVPLTRDYITDWEAKGRNSAEIRAA